MTGLVVLSAAIVLSACLFTFADRPRVLTSRARRTVIVTLKSGVSFRGVIAESDSQALVLKGATALGDVEVPVDGELVVLRADVDYLQLP